MANLKDTSIDGNLTLNGDISVLPGGGSTTKIWDSKVNKWTFYNTITTMDLNCSTTLSSSSIKTNNLTIGNNIMDDFVIDQGTSGIWTYRKWNSGVKECWGSADIRNLSCTNKHSDLEFYTHSQSSPLTVSLLNNLFSQVDSVTCTMNFETNYQIMMATILRYNTSQIQYRIWSSSSGSLNSGSVDFYVFGT